MRARAGSSLHLRSAQHTIAAIALAALALVVALRGLHSPDPRRHPARPPGRGALCSRRMELLQPGRELRFGAEAERSVGKVLERNVPEGFKLTHCVPKRGGGDLDHVLRSRRLTIVARRSALASTATRSTRQPPPGPRRGSLAPARDRRDLRRSRQRPPALRRRCLAARCLAALPAAPTPVA